MTGGSSVAYTRSSAGNSTVTYGGTTITGNAAPLVSSNTPASFSGGDGGASGGLAVLIAYTDHCGGAVGGNGTPAVCRRNTATNISGLFAALTLAGVSTTETCAASAAFGSGGVDEKYGPAKTAGLGGGGVTAYPYDIIAGTPAGAGAVVLYFT